MPISSKQALLQRANPVYQAQKASARAQSLAQPQDLLGTAPPYPVRFDSELARALQGPDAARIVSQLQAHAGAVINGHA